MCHLAVAEDAGVSLSSLLHGAHRVFFCFRGGLFEMFVHFGFGSIVWFVLSELHARFSMVLLARGYIISHGFCNVCNAFVQIVLNLYAWFMLFCMGQYAQLLFSCAGAHVSTSASLSTR